jgi:hypothetical protein
VRRGADLPPPERAVPGDRDWNWQSVVVRRLLGPQRHTVFAIAVVLAAAGCSSGANRSQVAPQSLNHGATSAGSTPEVTVTATSSAPAVGALVTFTVVERGGPIVYGITPAFGDGTANSVLVPTVGFSCGVVTSAENRSRTFQHAYEGAGDFVFTATAIVGDPCSTALPPTSPVGRFALQVSTRG